MCGIAGIVGTAPMRRQALEGMLSAMLSRGPDAQGIFEEPRIILGHRRLKIIDVSDDGNQPIPNENGSLQVVFNGEIYNYRTLRQQLLDNGHRFKSNTDTEVIVHGYEQWGIGVITKLRGMFAFALWDSKKNTLLLARDRLGIKPLYYCEHQGVFAFSSEVRALVKAGLTSKKLNPQAVHDYLAWGACRDPHTIITGINALSAGHYLLLNGQDITLNPFWNARASYARSACRRISFTDAAQELRSLMHETIDQHLISDVPLGIFLSGGIDSSALASFARAHRDSLITLTLGFDEPSLDERAFARTIAKTLGTEHREQVIRAEDIREALPSALEAMDQPTFDGINTYFVSRAARSCGVTVALSGLGGDELFCGYHSFNRIARLRGYARLLQELPLLRTLAPILSAGTPVLQRDKIGEFIRQHQYFDQTYHWLRALFTIQQRAHLMGKAHEAFAALSPSITAEPSDAINRISWLELTHYMRDVLLRDTDSMSMAHSLEVRVPFLDHHVVEFALSLPGPLKLSGGAPKALLRESTPSPLPRAIFERKKMGFVLPFAQWMRTSLKDNCQNVFTQPAGPLDEIIRAESARAVWDGFLHQHCSWQRAWALYVLRRWVASNLQ
jgi:asparagine synthase (glutamine-hydrolysing)